MKEKRKENSTGENFQWNKAALSLISFRYLFSQCIRLVPDANGSNDILQFRKRASNEFSFDVLCSTNLNIKGYDIAEEMMLNCILFGWVGAEHEQQTNEGWRNIEALSRVKVNKIYHSNRTLLKFSLSFFDLWLMPIINNPSKWKL